MHRRKEGHYMQVDISSLKNIITADSKTDFEIGTLSNEAKEEAYIDKVFIGYTDKESPDDFFGKEKNIHEDTKDEVSKIKENVEKISENILSGRLDLYEEMGFAPEKEDVTSLVTVTDRVKIQMAKYNSDYNFAGSNIDISVLEEVTGSQSAAFRLASQIDDASKMYSELKDVNEGIKEYLVRNQMEPTIENVYKANYSGAKASTNLDNIDDSQWDKIENQVKDILNKVGIETNRETIENAKWLINRKIPVSPDSIKSLQNIEEIDLNIEEKNLLNKMVKNYTLGIEPKETQIITGDDFLQRAVKSVDVINSATDSSVEEVLKNELELTVSNLEKYSSYNSEISSKRKLEEIRLNMTVEASINMLKKGINIEVEPLMDMVEKLKVEEAEYYKSLFDTDEYSLNSEDVELLNQTLKVADYLKTVPSPVVGKILYDDKNITVNNLRETAVYAMEKYEEMSTQIRSDLGDSYKKAFSSIDGILEELEFENNTSNQRAVKILSYNNIDISKESVLKVKESYNEFSILLDSLKPKTVAHLISEKVNPLNMSIENLNEKISEINEIFDVSEEEKFSEFLWKSDKNGSLTKEERDAFIGTYRLLYMVEKNDFSPIGFLMKQGKEITLNNLATAIKSNKSKNMDFVVDDDFGEFEDLKIPETSLSSQLKYFSNMIKDVKGKVSPDILKNIADSSDFGEITLESLADQVKEKYVNEVKEFTEELVNTSDDEIQQLLDMHQKVTPQNLILSGNIIGSKRGLFKYLDDEIGTGDEDMTDLIDDSEKLQEKYSEMETKLENRISEKLQDDSTNYVDIKNLKLAGLSMKMLKSAVSKKYYQIPFIKNGEQCLMKLTVVSNEKDIGKITVEH